MHDFVEFVFFCDFDFQKLCISHFLIKTPDIDKDLEDNYKKKVKTFIKNISPDYNLLLKYELSKKKSRAPRVKRSLLLKLNTIKRL